jgi:predicted ATP-dependent serine protease
MEDEGEDMEKEVNRRNSIVDSEFNIKLQEGSNPITRICITGGPCAGKTTALAEL